MSGKFDNVTISRLKTPQRWEEGLEEAWAALRTEIFSVTPQYVAESDSFLDICGEII